MHSDVNTRFLRSATTVLATHGWEKTDDPTFGDMAIEGLVDHFQKPLEMAGFDQVQVLDEWHALLWHAKMYFNLQDHYRKTWWKIFNCANTGDWSNILLLVELIFSLLVSNSAVERVFSRLNLVKTDKRCRLGEDRLDQLVQIAFDGAPLEQWDASDAIQVWWKDKQWREACEKSRAPTSSATVTQKYQDSEFN